MRPRVYVYENLPRPFSDWDVTATSAFREAFGQPLRRVGNVQLSDTSGYAFGAMLHYRLWHSRMYRTRDPLRADLFFVPLLTAPKRTYALGQACAAARANMTMLLDALPHLSERTARRHFVVLSKEHVDSSSQQCLGWFRRPVGLLARAMRVAYSSVQPRELRASAYWTPTAAHPARDEWEDPLGEYPNLFSVPFPSSIHAISADTGSAPPPWDTRLPRRHAASFVGTVNHGDLAVRRQLLSQCRQMGARCVFTGFGKGSALPVKQASDFCLEAAGDTPFRKSLADSVGMGCIPLLFHPMTDHANEWLWAGWKEAARVVAPRDALIEGRLNLSQLIGSAPAPLLTRMKATLAQHARRFQISLEDDDDDEVHMILTAMAEAAAAAEGYETRLYFPGLKRIG